MQCKDKRFDCYKSPVGLAPSHLVYSNRSHTLYRLNRLQAALESAEAAIKLRPHWVKDDILSSHPKTELKQILQILACLQSPRKWRINAKLTTTGFLPLPLHIETARADSDSVKQPVARISRSESRTHEPLYNLCSPLTWSPLTCSPRLVLRTGVLGLLPSRENRLGIGFRKMDVI
ncbi:hypothetical protein J6590_005057 [Homalodisca vitripennis]|nr:hypothetical protein J6590_005057 [Homalodisca vitripennis]